jgi:hypothetical protein
MMLAYYSACGQIGIANGFKKATSFLKKRCKKLLIPFRSQMERENLNDQEFFGSFFQKNDFFGAASGTGGGSIFGCGQEYAGRRASWAEGIVYSLAAV